MDVKNLPVLEGAAVRLRPIADADTDLIVKWRNTPSVVQNFIFRQTFTPEMHRSWLATKVATGQVVQYIIIDKADDKPVGSVYYRDIDGHRISLRVLAENTAARRSYEKAGFVQEGIFRDMELLDGQYRDVVFMARLAEK